MVGLFYRCQLPMLVVEIDELEALLKSRIIDGEPVDRKYEHIIHTFLCLLAATYPSTYNHVYRIQGEAFERRLEVNGVSDFVSNVGLVCETLAEQLKKESCKRVAVKLFTLLRVLKTLMDRAEHFLSNAHRSECRHYKLLLPFTFCRGLVRKRVVEIIQGKAQLHCSHWRSLMIDVYGFILELEIDWLRPVAAVLESGEDDRVRRLLSLCASRLGSSPSCASFKLLPQQVDEAARYFPPCMANLHKILRETHRLSFESRYQYTVFLKDAGMSSSENIEFWKDEYTKPGDGAVCPHTWEGRGSKYTYQIKHLYGETAGGFAKNSRPCSVFTGKLLSKMDGGCPFVHFSANGLRSSIPTDLMPGASTVLQLAESGCPNRACAAYLKLQLQSRKVPTEILTPLQYFNLASR